MGAKVKEEPWSCVECGYAPVHRRSPRTGALSYDDRDAVRVCPFYAGQLKAGRQIFCSHLDAIKDQTGGLRVMATRRA